MNGMKDIKGQPLKVGDVVVLRAMVTGTNRGVCGRFAKLKIQDGNGLVMPDSPEVHVEPAKQATKYVAENNPIEPVLIEPDSEWVESPGKEITWDGSVPKPKRGRPPKIKEPEPVTTG